MYFFHMKKFHFRLEKKPYLQQSSQEELTVKYKYIGGQYGEVDWILNNGTSQNQLVGLVRGAILNINNQKYTIPEYLFGRAFGDVYFLLGASQYLTDLKNIPLYTLAVYNKKTIGFVFQIPPKTSLVVPEYGFNGLQSISAYLVPVKISSEKPEMFISIYDYAEVLQYYSEAGQNYGFLPDPYAFNSYVVSADNLGYEFHERTILPIPNEWINLADKIISLFKKL
ncbi:hypothetical protein SBRV1_gp28 [Sulfolobales Beppu rod-shaped virus 1]|uniref:Uncharacterized protein n=1 Tax=Sulfolobales Beppu rod-shaped virus 1 TaxID=2493121 RepID=A0A3Q8Q407_9VIRU|nr:hypothetical protein QIT32_gp28 [Sulfolobales Beppu rod-shaped virus 1]AZI75917.1 hypothetical protein SBRV1_gp28 [Sulfolobales Beppu rod-shaped virus 1]